MFDFMPNGKPQGYTGDLAQSTDTWENIKNNPVLPGPDTYQAYKDQLPSLVPPTTPVDTTPVAQPNILQNILGGIKWYGTHPAQLVSEIGQGLASTLNEYQSRNNAEINNILASSSSAPMAEFGKQLQSEAQARQDYWNANPITTVPGQLGQQLPELPLWALGEGALTKLAPKAITDVASKLPDFISGGLKDAATYGTIVAPTEAASQTINHENNNSFLQNLATQESQLPTVALGGIALRGAGRALDTGLKSVSPDLKLAPELNAGELAKDNQLQSLNNPLQDIQNAYQTPSLRDVQAQDYQNIFKNVEAPSTQNNMLRAENPSQYFGNTTQADVEAAFPPLKAGQYSFTTDEQRAMNELSQGMQTAQNYVGHNDVLAAYPPGTSIDQAYADIKANTGVDIPKLADNLVQAQNAKTTLTPEELRMGKVAGVIPDLKPRVTPEPTVSPTIEQPAQPNIFERRTWTNRDNIPPAGTAPIKSITPENVGQLPGGIKPGPGFGKTTAEPNLQVAAASMEKPSVSNEPTLYTLKQREATSDQPTNGIDMLATQPKGLGKVKATIQSIPELPGKVYSQLWDNLSRLNSSNKVVNPENILQDVHKMGLLTRSARGTVEHINNVALVDRAGKEIGEGWNSITSDIPKNLEKEFNDYLLQKHNVPRSDRGKPIFSGQFNGESSAQIAAGYEAAHPEFKSLNQRVNTFITKLSDAWGVDSGLVEKELMNYSRGLYPDFVPTYRQLESASSNGGYGRLGPAKVFKKAVGGDEKIIPPTESVPMLVNKLVTNSRKNEVYQALLNQVRANPGGMRKFAELVKPDEELAASLSKAVENHGIDGALDNNALIDQPTKGHFLVVMENGKPTSLKINDNEYWKALSEVAQPRRVGDIESFGRKVTQPFKNVVTGYNPIFSVNNIARDIPTAVINSIEKNPAYAALNIKDAVQQMATGSRDFKEFVALGGAEGNFFKNTTGIGKFNPIGKVGQFNNAVESIPRFAEYLATIKKGGGTYESKLEGIYNAAEVTTNFSRHGNLIKKVDSWVPYLNPAFQGLDKVARQAISKPLPTLAKGALTVTVPSLGLYAYNQAVAKDSYDKLDPRTRDNYYNFPLGDGKFFKLAKPREAGVLFGSLPERLLNQTLGKPDAFKGFGNTVATNFAPNNPLNNNYLSPVMTNIPSNKDFADRPIVPLGLQGLSPRLQYDTKTSETAKAIGNQFNVSPKQVDYLAKSYLGVIGQLGIPAMTKNANIFDAVTRPFIADSAYSNTIMDNFYNTKNSIDMGTKDAKATGDNTLAIGQQYKTIFNNTANKLTDLRKEANNVQSNNNLSQQDKETELRAIQLRMLDYAKAANDRYNAK